LPISYEKKSAPKGIIENNNLALSDINSFGSKIGLITNQSTTLYSMLSLFEKDSIEYKMIMERLKICRKLQGNEIDKQKGIITKKIPEWGRWIKLKSSMTLQEIEQINIQNKIIIDKRPLWMTYLYPHKMNEYKKYNKIYENYCQSKFGYGLDVLLSKKRHKKEQEIYEKYVKYIPFLINSNGIMDKVYKYISNQIKEYKISLKKDFNFDFNIYIDKNISLNKIKLEKMEELYKEYKSFKRKTYETSDYENFEQMAAAIKNKALFNISSNINELANLAVRVCYQNNSQSEMCWSLFGEGIINNMLSNSNRKIIVPILDHMGKINFLNKNYSEKEFRINDLQTFEHGQYEVQ